MRPGLLMPALLLLACGQPAASTESPGPVVSASPAASPAACRLPLSNVVNGSDFNRHGSWLELPSGTVAPDPTADFTFDNQASLYRSQAQPVLVGNDGSLS